MVTVKATGVMLRMKSKDKLLNLKEVQSPLKQFPKKEKKVKKKLKE